MWMLTRKRWIVPRKNSAGRDRATYVFLFRWKVFGLGTMMCQRSCMLDIYWEAV
jgi:hypothetical protein